VQGINGGTELVAAFCSAPTSNGGYNSASGMPGADRMHLAFNLTAYCPDGVTPYENGGANCP
jgi:hypothetical protein